MAGLRHLARGFLMVLASGALSACATMEPVTPLDPSAKSGAPTADGIALLSSVGISQTTEFDRVTFGFRGQGTPGFRAAYVDPPITEDGSGQPVQIAGERYLEIRMEPASGADLSGPELVITYPGPHRLSGPDGGVVREAVRTGDFEAVLTWVVGLDRQAPFRISRGTDPARLVLDVARQ